MLGGMSTRRDEFRRLIPDIISRRDRGQGVPLASMYAAIERDHPDLWMTNLIHTLRPAVVRARRRALGDRVPVFILHIIRRRKDLGRGMHSL
jgi:hypothetical protein